MKQRTMAISNRDLSALKNAIDLNQVVRIRYDKEDKEYKKPKPYGTTISGETVTRNLEPYDIITESLRNGKRKTYLYGYDITRAVKTRGRIKKFNLEGIKNARLLQQWFSPRDWSRE